MGTERHRWRSSIRTLSGRPDLTRVLRSLGPPRAPRCVHLTSWTGPGPSPRPLSLPQDRTSRITAQIWRTHRMMASGTPDTVTARSVELGSRSPATCTWAPVVCKWRRGATLAAPRAWRRAAQAQRQRAGSPAPLSQLQGGAPRGWLPLPLTSRISLILVPAFPISEPHWLAGMTRRRVTGGLETVPPLAGAEQRSWAGRLWVGPSHPGCSPVPEGSPPPVSTPIQEPCLGWASPPSCSPSPVPPREPASAYTPAGHTPHPA